MPTNEELLALLQKIHEIARQGYEENRDSGYLRDADDYEIGKADAFQEIVGLIEPTGFTFVPPGNRLPCPNCNTDIHTNLFHFRDGWFIHCGGCGARGPNCELESSADEMWNLWVKETEDASETN